MTMTAKILRLVARILLLAGIGLSSVIAAHAQQSAADALRQARVIERLSDGMAVEKKAKRRALDSTLPGRSRCRTIG